MFFEFVGTDQESKSISHVDDEYNGVLKVIMGN